MAGLFCAMTDTLKVWEDDQHCFLCGHLNESGLKLVTAGDLDDAARKAVAQIR